MSQEAKMDSSSLPDPGTPPPPMKGKYTQERALEDLPGIKYALAMFLNSKMLESEQYCLQSDPSKERLYFASGYGLIQCVKALMSYEDEDLLAAINHTRHGNAIASLHRKKHAALPMRLVGLVTGNQSNSGIGFIKSMNPVERHAELIYAETLFEKALLGIVYSGDWLAFVKEALNMRTTFNIYQQLGKFVTSMDEEASARGEGSKDASIDEDFRSGVFLGVGMSNLILSLLPSRVLSIIELFGYKGDRMLGLKMLQKAGGWTSDADEPSVDIAHEGIRRSICDMTLMIFHLVFSGFTYAGIDTSIAQKILEWNLKRYPNGVFFLFGQGRLRLVRGQPALAIESYSKAMTAQTQYRNLNHISYWEIGIAYMALWNIEESFKCWKILQEGATWSKATYTYGVAVCLLQMGSPEQLKEAETCLDKIPSLLQKIAGKSIPMEKFVARKARKFKSQKGRLALPALEIAYVFSAIARSPRDVITGKMLPVIQQTLDELKAHEEKPSEYGGGQGYWDDFCLANFLAGVCLRFVAYPDPDAVVDPDEKVAIPQKEAADRSMASLQRVLDNGQKIQFDHHLVYMTHYEMGRLYARIGQEAEARKHLELVLSGKPLEANPSTRKGKYSLENAMVMRANASIEALDEKRLV